MRISAKSSKNWVPNKLLNAFFLKVLCDLNGEGSVIRHRMTHCQDKGLCSWTLWRLLIVLLPLVILFLLADQKLRVWLDRIFSTWQLMENGMCRLVATLPQLDERRCPDMFRCSDEVSYWLHENEERKDQIVTLKETISELQEDLRNHRHRIKVLELQVTKQTWCIKFLHERTRS